MGEEKTVSAEFEDLSGKALEALQGAFYDLVRERRKADDTLVLSVNGQPCDVRAKDIPLPEEDR